MRAYALRWIAILLASAAAALLWFSLPFLMQSTNLPPITAGTSGESQELFVVPPQRDAAASDGTAILARPLFGPTRRPFVPVPLAAESEEVEAEPAPQPEPEVAALSYDDPAQLRLMGVLLTDNIASALIATPDRPEGKWFERGSEVIGWTIDAIAPNSVTLKVSDKTHVIQHYQQGSE